MNQTDTDHDSTRLRALVVGCPRSGTTLIQARLAAHPAVFTFPETQLFQKLVGMQRQLAGIGSLRSAREKRTDFIRNLLLHFGFGRTVLPAYSERLKEIGDHIGAPEFRDWKFPDTRRLSGLVGYAAGQFDAAAERAGKRGWLEKSPTHLRYRRLIERYIPGARFVHVVRDGRATVASIWEAVQKGYPHWETSFPTIDACVATWNSDLRRTVECESLPQHLVLNYHHFCRAPEQHCQTAWKFLGLDTAVQAPADHNSANQSVLPYEQWKQAVGQPTKDYGLKKFEEMFTADEQKQIEQGLTGGGDVVHLGKQAMQSLGD